MGIQGGGVGIRGVGVGIRGGEQVQGEGEHV